MEHRQVKAQATKQTPDFKLKASGDKDAPITLLSMILAGGNPMTEGQLVRAIFKLAAFSAALALATAVMMMMGARP